MNTLSVDFHQDKLMLVEHNGEPYVPMRPIVENMGLDWKGQHTKLKQRFSTCVEEITIQMPNDNQHRAYTCLPLRKLFGWLMMIMPNKVKPQLKDKIIQYQNECDDVLWRYWTNQAQRHQDQLNELLLQAHISKAKGSFHGRGLYERKKEKRALSQKISALQAYIQPKLSF